jgi:flagellar biosynthesis chaperone FliJ
MKHVEDSVIDGSVTGVRTVIDYFKSLRNMLAGSTSDTVNLSVKWDGSPAIFAGIDPSDGKFFVAKKGLFNKNPKVYKTQQDINDDLSGALRDKFTIALKELSKLGIKGVVQGDFLYSSDDIEEDNIDGEPHITFHPNTIVYAVPKKSDLAKRILKSKIGVVWHTIYRGESFETLSATFGKEIAIDLKEVGSVWSVDAVFKDSSGLVTFTKQETDEVTMMLSNADRVFTRVKKAVLDELSNNTELNLRVNTYINSKIRAGERIIDLAAFMIGLTQFIEEYYQKLADKRKTLKGKTAQMDKKNSVLSFFNKFKQKDIENVFILYNILVDIKLVIIDKLNKVDGLKTLLKTNKGYEVTGQEGFVAIDRYGKNSLKLVDRLQFSKANFSSDYIKGWQK